MEYHLLITMSYLGISLIAKITPLSWEMLILPGIMIAPKGGILCLVAFLTFVRLSLVSCCSAQKMKIISCAMSPKAVCKLYTSFFTEI